MNGRMAHDGSKHCLAANSRLAVLLAILAGFGLSAATVQAQPSAMDRAAAQSLFDDAMRLMAEGSFDAACPKFEESQRIDPGLGTQFNLADCFEKTGKTASAWVNFSEVADSALKEGNMERERVARERANMVLKRVAYLTVSVPHPLEGLIVERDGVPLHATAWGTALPLDPGKHVIEASAPNKQTWVTSVELGKDGGRLEATVPELLDAPLQSVNNAQPATTVTLLPSAPMYQPSPDEPAASSSHQKTWALLCAGVGAVGLGVGTGLLISAADKHSQADPYCNANNQCSAPGLPLRHDAKALANIATIPLGIGIVGAIAGITLWFTAPKTTEANRVATGLALSPNELTLQGKF